MFVRTVERSSSPPTSTDTNRRQEKNTVNQLKTIKGYKLKKKTTSGIGHKYIKKKKNHRPYKSIKSLKKNMKN